MKGRGEWETRLLKRNFQHSTTRIKALSGGGVPKLNLLQSSRKIWHLVTTKLKLVLLS